MTLPKQLRQAFLSLTDLTPPATDHLLVRAVLNQRGTDRNNGYCCAFGEVPRWDCTKGAARQGDQPLEFGGHLHGPLPQECPVVARRAF
jgi:hypothetical protein